jgi:hypothetical protein
MAYLCDFLFSRGTKQWRLKYSNQITNQQTAPLGTYPINLKSRLTESLVIFHKFFRQFIEAFENDDSIIRIRNFTQPQLTYLIHYTCKLFPTLHRSVPNKHRYSILRDGKGQCPWRRPIKKVLRRLKLTTARSLGGGWTSFTRMTYLPMNRRKNGSSVFTSVYTYQSKLPARGYSQPREAQPHE